MKRLNELISEIEKILIEIQFPILSKMQQGLTSDVVRSSLKEINITNDELLIFYTWRNGVKDINDGSKIEELELFPEGIMLSIEEAINHYKISLKQDLWSKKLFPIFTNGGGDYFVLDCNENSVVKGMVFLYAPSLLLDENPQSIYDSFESLLLTVLSCYKQGAYKTDYNGKIDVDYDLKYELSAKFNPKSAYWDDYR